MLGGRASRDGRARGAPSRREPSGEMLEVRPPRRAVGSSRGATHAHPRAERGEEAAQRADAEVADEGVPGVRRAGHAGLRRRRPVQEAQGADGARGRGLAELFRLNRPPRRVGAPRVRRARRAQDCEGEIAMAGIPESFRDLFSKKAFAHLATVGADGPPQVTPVWCDFDGTHVRINTARGRVKDRNLQANPRVALSILDPDNPYRYLQVRGRVVAMTEAGADSPIDALATKDLDQDTYPYRRPGEV